MVIEGDTRSLDNGSYHPNNGEPNGAEKTNKIEMGVTVIYGVCVGMLYCFALVSEELVLVFQHTLWPCLWVSIAQLPTFA